MLMNSRAPAAPPPMQPVTPNSNPYQFITDPQKPFKKQLFSGNSKLQRILIIVGAVSVLIAATLVLFSILNSASSAVRNDYQNLLQQQTEIIRVSEIGISKARGTDAKNLAVTTKLSLESSLSELTALAKGARADTNAKTLTLGKDAETDKALTTADQANRFDEAFAAKLTELLNEYQQTLKRLYDQANKESTKLTLGQAYNNASLLMQNGKQ